MLKVTWPRAAAWRLRRHFLDRRAPAGSMLAVTSRLCGVHAQVMSSAELTLWARVENLDRETVRRALWEDRTLVKTWAMRGTLHLLPAAELPLWHAVLGTSRRYLRPALWQKYFGISIEELDRITEAVGAALHGRVLSREELTQAVTRTLSREMTRLNKSPAFAATFSANSWGTILKPAAFAGWLCFGPGSGTRVRFTHPGSWLPPFSPIDAETAIPQVTRRFLAAYGPATYHDLARWWSGGGIATARQWIASLGEEVCAVDLAGSSAWMLAADVRSLRELPPLRSVRLLPGFDQYVIGASCHAANLLPGDLRSRVYRPQGWISPVLLVNGRMDGVWRHQIKGSRVEVRIEPFVKPPSWVRRAAVEEAERLAAFLGGSLELTWGT